MPNVKLLEPDYRRVVAVNALNCKLARDAELPHRRRPTARQIRLFLIDVEYQFNEEPLLARGMSVAYFQALPVPQVAGLAGLDSVQTLSSRGCW